MTVDQGPLMRNLMAEVRRAFLCLLSLALVCTVFWLMWGTRLPGSLNLHRHYPGFAAVLLTILLLAVAFGLRGRLEKGVWPVIIGALFGYLSASFAYVVYFGLLEPGLLVSSIRRRGIGTTVAVIFLLPPLATFSWLLGALSGAFFVVLRQEIQRAKLRP